MITLQKEPFLQAIRAVKSSCGKANLQPILSTIHLKSENGGLTLTTTDLDNAAKSSIEANIMAPIDVCVNADKLDSIVSRLDDTIILDIKDAFLIIISNNTKFEILWQSPEDFPEPNFELSDNKITLSSEIFISSINKTCLSTQNDVGSVLNGICLVLDNDAFEFASTDGNRLSQIFFKTPLQKKGQYIIPKKILLDVEKVAKQEVEMFFIQNGAHEKIILKTNNCLYMGNLFSKAYPKYRQIIPQNQPKKVQINRSTLINALEKVAIMTNNTTFITEFVFSAKNSQLELFTKNDGGNAESKIDVSLNFDEDFKIAFNYKFILEGIKAMETENIVLEMNDTLSCCLIKSNNFLYLVMPCQIK